jgi:hypothetical protein
MMSNGKRFRWITLLTLFMTVRSLGAAKQPRCNMTTGSARTGRFAWRNKHGNGHERLIATEPFAAVGDFTQAQSIADDMRVKALHRKLEAFVRRYCPAIADLGVTYHWSIDQAEYSTDIIFRRQADLGAIYDRLTRTAIHTVKPENVATFLGRKLNGNYQDELGNRFDTRIEGTRIKHTMGPVSLKMYDKHGFILRMGFGEQRNRKGTY